MNNSYWYQDAIFYHIYPLGLCGAPEQNRFNDPVENRLDQLYPWLAHARSLGATALYLGPVFESSTHGYDTSDYYQVDRRLGDNPSFTKFAEAVHQQGMQLVLDGVFNHVGRDFWAFRDVLDKGGDSPYLAWFQNLRFGETSPKGDPFSYESWQGHYDLVKLNLQHPDVRAHLFEAIGMWMDQFGIDGLRLDAADCIDLDFLRALHTFVKGRRADFWLMGEVVHGNYRDWANPEILDSVTNYACYKGLYSSLNDGNYFEIAHNLERQFGEEGCYQDLYLYNFVDNHDVDRVASKLAQDRLLFPLYLLLYSMPGMPSIYYGSEWGIKGVKEAHTDAPLRPYLDLSAMHTQPPQPGLLEVIRKLGEIRRGSSALRHGDFKILSVDHHHLVFLRQTPGETIMVALNSAAQEIVLELPMPANRQDFADLLSPGEVLHGVGGNIRVLIPPYWGRILKCIC
jgi:glycosidase